MRYWEVALAVVEHAGSDCIAIGGQRSLALGSGSGVHVGIGIMDSGVTRLNYFFFRLCSSPFAVPHDALHLRERLKTR